MRSLADAVSSNSSVDWVARSLAIAGFVINVCTLVITYLRGRRVRATMTFRVVTEADWVEVAVVAHGTFPVSIVEWGVVFNKTRFFRQKRADDNHRQLRFKYDGTGTDGPEQLPAILEAGRRELLGVPLSDLQEKSVEHPDLRWVRGWVAVATRKRLVRTRAVTFTEIENAFSTR